MPDLYADYADLAAHETEGTTDTIVTLGATPTPPATIIERTSLVTSPHSSLLDLDPWVGQRAATFRFDLVDGPTNMRLGEIHPITDQPPTLSHDVTRTITRQLSPLLLGVSETRDIDPIRHRVLPIMVLSNGEEWPLGRYMFTDYTQVRFTSGSMSTSTLVDEMFIVDQKTEVAFTSKQTIFGQGLFFIESVDVEIKRLLEELPVTVRAEPTSFSSVGAWQQGTNRGQIVSSLALDGDYFAPWFDNTGELRLIRSFDPANKVPDFDWDSTGQVLRDGVVVINDLLDAWNRVIVVSNGIGQTINIPWDPIVGVYDVPTSAPHSFTNRGFRITEVRSLQVALAGQARAMAANIGQRETTFERVELSTVPDPRHDSHNVIRWEGENWLELSWSLPLQEGAEMQHVLRKAYTP